MTFIDDWNQFYETCHDIKDTLELYPISGDKESVKLGMPLHQGITQPAGMFSAPALFGLADLCATWLSMQQVEPGLFPLAVQSSINVISNTKTGDAIATARIVKAGRMIIVTDTEITSSETGAILAKVSCTYALPRSAK